MGGPHFPPLYLIPWLPGFVPPPPPSPNPVFPVNPNGEFIARTCPFLPLPLAFLCECPHKLASHLGAAPCSWFNLSPCIFCPCTFVFLSKSKYFSVHSLFCVFNNVNYDPLCTKLCERCRDSLGTTTLFKTPPCLLSQTPTWSELWVQGQALRTGDVCATPLLLVWNRWTPQSSLSAGFVE